MDVKHATLKLKHLSDYIAKHSIDMEKVGLKEDPHFECSNFSKQDMVETVASF